MPEINEVRQHIENWIQTFVSIPNSKLGGFVPCPYSKEVILRNRIDIRWFNGPDLLDVLIKLTETWNDTFDLVLLATTPNNIDTHTMQSWVEQANHTLAKYDLFAIKDHPDGQALETLETNGKYALVFIQRFSKLQEASEQLAQMGYYQSWSKQEFDFVIGFRSQFLHYISKQQVASSDQ